MSDPLPLLCDAADFRDNIVRRGSRLTGAVDGSCGIISLWLRIDGTPTGPSANKSAIFPDAQNCFSFGKIEPTLGHNANQFVLQLKGPWPASVLLQLYSATAYLNGTGEWRHLLFSWKLPTGDAKVYVNDVLDTLVARLTNGIADYTDNDWGVGCNPPGGGGTDRLRGAMAELYVNISEYLDLSVEENRRKFITVDGKPADLGTDGSGPTGHSPLVYLSLRRSEPKPQFLVNRGTAGNFLEDTGTLRVAVGNPSDAATRMDAAAFNGSSYLKRGGSIGASDSKCLTIAGWFRVDGGDWQGMRLLSSSSALAGTNDRLRINRNTLNQVIAIAANQAGIPILTMNTVATYTSGPAWHSVLLSVDMSDPLKRHLYVDDIELSVATVYTDDLIALNVADWSLGANPNGTNPLQGALADWHVYPGIYTDFSIEANRRKFVSASGKPVDTGSNGIIPFGVIPAMLCRLHDGEDASNFGFNLGSGGALSVTGSLSTASTSPTD